MLRFIVVDLADDLGEGDVDKVLAAIRMTKGVKSADITSDTSEAWGAYLRCRRAYGLAIRAALDETDKRLAGPDGGIIAPPRPTRFPDVQ